MASRRSVRVAVQLSLSEQRAKEAAARAAAEAEQTKQKAPTSKHVVQPSKSEREAARMAERLDDAVELEAKLDALADLVRTSKRLIVYTGAGISTVCSLPDYRGPDGVWTRLKQGLDAPEMTVPISQVQPSDTHMALATLVHKKIVKHVVSQNCDGLHRRSGIPQERLSEIHGNTFIEVCTNCRPQRLHPREFDVTWLTKYKQHETGRLCTVCQQPLVDTIVHFKELGGERAPQVLNWSAAMRQAADADTIICLGSSLAVLQHYNDLWKRKKAVPLVANANSGNSQETSPADAQPASATLATATSPSAGTEPSQALSEVDAPPVANNTNVKSEATPELGSLTSDDPLPVDNPSSSSDGTPSEPQPGSSEPSSSQAEWSDSSTSASQASSSSLLPSERTTRRHRLAIVNLQWTPRDRYADIKIHARCDFVMAGLMQRLGLVASVYSRDKDPLFRTCIPLTAAEEALVWRDVQERLSEKRRHESESEAVAATESSLAAWQPNTEKSSSTNSLMLEYQTLQQLLAQPLLHDPSVISEAATRFQNVQLQLTALAPNPSSLGVGFLPQETGNTVSFGAAPGSSFLASAVVPLAPAWLGSTVSRKKPRLEPS